MSPRNIDSSITAATIEPLLAVRPAPAKSDAPSFDSHLQRAAEPPARRSESSPSKPSKSASDKRPAARETADNRPADHAPAADSAKPSDQPAEQPGEELAAVSEQAQNQAADNAPDDDKEASPSEEQQPGAQIVVGDAAAIEQAQAAASSTVAAPAALDPQATDDQLAGESDSEQPTNTCDDASNDLAQGAKRTNHKEKARLPSATLQATGKAVEPDARASAAETEPAAVQAALSEVEPSSTTDEAQAEESAAEKAAVKVSDLHATQTHPNVSALTPQPSAKSAPDAEPQSSRGEPKRDAKKSNHSKSQEADGKAKSSAAARRVTADESAATAVNAAAAATAATQSASGLAASDQPTDRQPAEFSAPKPHEPSLQAATAIDSQTPRQPLADAAAGAPSRTASTANHATGRTERGPVVSESDRNRFVNRVAKAFQSASERGGPLRLRLSPPELGSLKMEVSIRDGALTARLEAETPEARAILLDNLPALRERLAEQNIKVERFDVELQSQTSGQSGGNHLPDTAADRDSRQGSSRGPRAKVNQSAGSTPVSPRSARRLGDDGQLNVVI